MITNINLAACQLQVCFDFIFLYDIIIFLNYIYNVQSECVDLKSFLYFRLQWVFHSIVSKISDYCMEKVLGLLLL